MPPSADELDFEAKLRKHGLENCARDVVRFVHGTTLDEGWTRQTQVDPTLGRGEYGAGFYAFVAVGEHGNLGIEKAKLRAEARARPYGGTPCLVFLEYPTQEFVKLKDIEVTIANAADHVKGKGAERKRVLDVSLMWGVVFRDGLIPLWGDQPKQYKFWGEAARLLRVTSVVRL